MNTAITALCEWGFLANVCSLAHSWIIPITANAEGKLQRYIGGIYAGIYGGINGGLYIEYDCI